MRPKPIKGEDLLKIISVALNRGRVIPSSHFRQRMRERNFDMADAITVLDGAKQVRQVWNGKARCWNYDIQGKDIEGEDFTIRIAPGEDVTGIVLVTGF